MTDKIQTWQSHQILQFLQQHSEKLRQFGVRKIGLFGSYVRDITKPNSDMDFLVVMSNPSYQDYINTKHFLEDSFGCEIDLVEEDYLRKELKEHIMEEVIFAIL